MSLSPQLIWRFFGPIHFGWDGSRIDGLRSRKAIALLAYLATQGTECPRLQLTDLFWPDLPEQRALANLSWTLSHLNHHLPGCVSGDRTTITFHPPAHIWIDVVVFRRLLRQATPETLAQAIDLYRGDFLQGLYLKGCPEFELWLVGEREYWQQQYTLSLETLMHEEAARHNYRQALAYAQRMLYLNAYREEIHQLIMRFLALSGQRGAALAQYEMCRRLLWTEMGLAPMPETSDLYEQIRTGVFPSEPPPAVSSTKSSLPADVLLASSPYASPLPTPYTSLIGREALLGQIVERFSSPGCRLITLMGPGGIGKTRVALHLAEQLRFSFRDGVCIVPLTALTSRDDVVAAIAQALGLSWKDAAHHDTSVFRTLATKEVLLVLDNFEHLLEASGLVSELLVNAPQLKIIVTSRERLQLRTEQVFVVPGLSLPEATDGDLTTASAVQLFLECARRVDPNLKLVVGQLAEVAQICRLLGGNPLGIELAAAWVDHLAPVASLQVLQQNLDCLSTTLRDVPERHRTMRAVFMWSWELLSPHEQRLLSRLSIFRDSFDRDTAQAVAGAMPADLEALQQKSLLQVIDSGMYQLHTLTRYYAAEQLRQTPGDYEMVARQHCLYYLALVEAAETCFFGSNQIQGFRQITQIYSDIQVALQWCVENKEFELGLRLAGALGRFWRARGASVEGRNWLDQMLPHATEVSPLVQIKALQAATWCALFHGAFDAARAYCTQSLELSRQLDAQANTARLLGLLSTVVIRQGERAQARSFVEEALALHQSFQDTWGLCNGLINLAVMATEDEEYDRAHMLYQELEPLLYVLDNHELRFIALLNQGLTYLYQGNYTQATTLLEASCCIAHDTMLPLAEGFALRGLGVSARQQADWPTAIAYGLQSLRILAPSGDLVAIAESFYHFASILRHTDLDHAARLCGAGAAILRRVGAVLPSREQHWNQAVVTELQAALGAEQFAVLELLGRTTPIDVIVQELFAAFDAVGPVLPDAHPQPSTKSTSPERDLEIKLAV